MLNMRIYVAMLALLMVVGSGCVCKDALVIGYEKRGGFGTTNANFDGPCTLWPKRAWNDAVFGRPLWMSIDEPWKAQKLITAQIRKGETIGFRRGTDGQVIAFAGQSQCTLPDDDYGWYRPKNPGEAVVEGGVLAPVRFITGGAAVAGIAVATMGTQGKLEIHRR